MEGARRPRPDSAPCHLGEEALRVQVQAIAARQAALLEEELQLQRRAEALRQQESQVAALLAEKHQRLLEVRDQARQERAALRAERAAAEEHLRQANARLVQGEADLAAGQDWLRQQRQRLFQLRRRLKRRWHCHWLAERQAARQVQDRLDVCAESLAAQASRLERDREKFLAARRRLQTQAVLRTKKLQAARTALRHEQRAWRARLARVRHALVVQDDSLRAREDELEAREATQQALSDRFRTACEALREEAEGLERRVANLRQRLAQQESLTRAAETSGSEPDHHLPVPAAPPAGSHGPFVPSSHRTDDGTGTALVARMVEELADQRARAREIVLRVARTHEGWLAQQVQAAVALEETARRLRQREAEIEAMERRGRALEAHARARQEQLTQRQQLLEAWQMRLALRAASWEAERDRSLADLEARARQTERLHTNLSRLRQRWAERRRREQEWLQCERAAVVQLRHLATGLRDEWLRRHETLGQLQQVLAERRLALQTLEQQASAGEDAAGFAARLERARRTFAALAEHALEPLVEIRRHLVRDAEALDARFAHWQQFAAVVARQEQELAERRVALEEERVLVNTQAVQARAEVHRLRLHAEASERQAHAANQEIERLAHVLLTDGAAPDQAGAEQPSGRAA